LGEGDRPPDCAPSGGHLKPDNLHIVDPREKKISLRILDLHLCNALVYMKKQCFCATLMCVLRAALLVSVCGGAWAQNAMVSGRVTDPSGGVIGDVAVELINHATQVKLPSITNAEGIFILPSVPPGSYEVNARIAGFTAAHIDSVRLEVGQSRTLNITLAVGDVKQSVTVTDEAPLVTTDRADRGTVVENRFVTSIPLLTRNPLLLVTMTAGAIGTTTPGGG
jgi:hypothetical protein